MFILNITSRYSHFNILFNKPCQSQYELLPSLGVRRLSSVYFSHFDRDKMNNLYRGPSIDASYQVLVHLAKQFQRRRFLKFGQSETKIACGAHVW
jgi:hypothetical protein